MSLDGGNKKYTYNFDVETFSKTVTRPRRGWEANIKMDLRFPEGAGNFLLHHCVQSSSGAHPASCPVGTRGSFPGGREVARA
jgi:hypothetical protein